MIIGIIGESSSGKNIISYSLESMYGYKPIVRYTTRERRNGEVDGKDYHFIPIDMFQEASERGLFAEQEDWREGRLYGSLKKDYETKEDRIIILTPNTLRQLNKLDIDIFTVYVKSNLGTRMKRYIQRIGTDKFTFKDKDELCSRVERDYAAYLGIEYNVDLVVKNDENSDLTKIIKEIHEECQRRK